MRTSLGYLPNSPTPYSRITNRPRQSTTRSEPDCGPRWRRLPGTCGPWRAWPISKARRETCRMPHPCSKRRLQRTPMRSFPGRSWGSCILGRLVRQRRWRWRRSPCGIIRSTWFYSDWSGRHSCAAVRPRRRSSPFALSSICSPSRRRRTICSRWPIGTKVTQRCSRIGSIAC